MLPFSYSYTFPVEGKGNIFEKLTLNIRAVILYIIYFHDSKVLVGASGAGLGFDKSEREIVISLSRFVDGAGHLQTWHGQRCDLFCFAPVLLSQMVGPAAIE